jgi:hypothetical protein
VVLVRCIFSPPGRPLECRDTFAFDVNTPSVPHVGDKVAVPAGSVLPIPNPAAAGLKSVAETPPGSRLLDYEVRKIRWVVGMPVVGGRPLERIEVELDLPRK